MARTLTVLMLVIAGCGGPAVQQTKVPVSTRGTEAAGASERCQRLLPLIRQAAQEEGVEAELLIGLVRTESNFRNDVRSPMGAIGLTQCLRSTAAAKRCGDLSDELQNLKCGARVLAAFLRHYGGDLYLALSGYNAGHAIPDKARKRSELPSNIEYVEDVLWARAVFKSRGCAF